MFISLWNNLSPKWQYEVKSAVKSFLAGAIVELCLQLQNGGGVLPTTKDVMIPLAYTVIRSGLRALETFIVSQTKE